MSNNTQWTNPPGICVTSGSSMTSANDLVPAGASVHVSAGDGLVWPASQVNFDGMLPPSVNAGLEIVSAAAAISPIMFALSVHQSSVVSHQSSVVSLSFSLQPTETDDW